MTSLAERLIRKMKEAEDRYHRLVLVVGPAGVKKTEALQQVASRAGVSVLNVNLDLSKRLLDLSVRQRQLRLPQILGEIVDSVSNEGELVLLDNIEVLFDSSLKQDPLKLLQGMSRNRCVVATWNGAVDGGHLTYAASGHPEYRRYPVGELLIVEVGGDLESTHATSEE